MLRDTPPGEDGLTAPRAAAGEIDETKNKAHAEAEETSETDDDGFEFDEKPSDQEFLQIVYEADSAGLQYISQVNRRSWERGYRAFHQQHFEDSKYLTTDFKNRSKLFIPKTRTGIRKHMAAVAASLFGSIDAVNCMPGNEGDPRQRGSAAVMQELVNYRTDRTSGKAAIKWFHTASGSCQTALLTGICISKQYWKLEIRRTGSEKFKDDDGDEKFRDVWKPFIDRPEIDLYPPENFTIDTAADWRDPAQDAAFVILKTPMRIDEIRRKQRDPRRPWRMIDENLLKAQAEGSIMNAEAIRRAREQGVDRYDKAQTTRHFDTVWVWETFVRTAGEDWHFFSIGSKVLLTDPAPVSEVYPEQYGERPLVMGYGSLEAFRIFPQAPVESWQDLQQEANDIRNLSLDSLKQNIMPVSKVVRGRNIDLDQLKRRGQGTSIMVQNKDDVTWEKVPDLSQGVVEMTQKLDIEFDDLAGQQNYGTVQNSNQLGKTLGGLKLAAGSANAVQEFDIRVWIESWCEPVLAQIVRLEQYYESDPIVLGLCGDRAQLLEKHGISEIDDKLLEEQVNLRINIGLGAGDPQARLAKFESAVQVALPLLELDPDFKSGKKQMDGDAVMQEVFGAAGYRDGGKRFIKAGAPQGPNPLQDAEVAKTQSEAEKNKAMAKKAVLDALSGAAKVGIDVQALEMAMAQQEFGQSIQHMDQMGKAVDLGHKHAHDINDRKKAAQGLNPDGSPMLPPGSSAGSGEGGGPPAGAAAGNPPGGGIVPGPNEAGAGDTAGVGQMGVPAANAGEQQQADAADQQANLQSALKKKNRTVTIAGRGPDGRANSFHIQEH